MIDPDVIIVGQPADTAVLALREALSCWFGTPLETPVPIIDRPGISSA